MEVVRDKWGCAVWGWLYREWGDDGCRMAVGKRVEHLEKWKEIRVG